MAVETPPQPDFLELLNMVWVQVFTLVGVVIWLIRGEGKTNANTAAILALQKQREEDLQAHREARENTNSTLIEVKDDLREVRSDIKTLLSRKVA